MQQLCLEVSNKGFAYSVVNRSSKEIIDADKIALTSRVAEDNKSTIKELLDKKGLLSFSGEVSLAIIGDKTTLVPQNVFGESSAKDIFKLCFGEKQVEIDYNRFPEQGLVNIYETIDWVKSFFVIRYPSIIMQHENTHVLRAIFSGPTFSPIVHLVMEAEYFSLLITSKNKLDFYNVFEYKSIEDIIYHTIFVMEQKEMNEASLKLVVHGSMQHEQLSKELKEQMQRIRPNKSVDTELKEKIKHQLFCV